MTTAAARCPICGEIGRACGGPSATKGVDAMVMNSESAGGRRVERPTERRVIRARDAEGNVFKVAEEDLARLGYTPLEEFRPTKGEGKSFEEAADQFVENVAGAKAEQDADNKARRAPRKR